MKLPFKKTEQPFSQKLIFRLMVILIILLSLLAGFYHDRLLAEQKRYARIEDLYVRVREELGREETQRLIDQSRKTEIQEKDN